MITPEAILNRAERIRHKFHTIHSQNIEGHVSQLAIHANEIKYAVFYGGTKLQEFDNSEETVTYFNIKFEEALGTSPENFFIKNAQFLQEI